MSDPQQRRSSLRTFSFETVFLCGGKIRFILVLDMASATSPFFGASSEAEYEYLLVYLVAKLDNVLKELEGLEGQVLSAQEAGRKFILKAEVNKIRLHLTILDEEFSAFKSNNTSIQ